MFSASSTRGPYFPLGNTRDHETISDVIGDAHMRKHRIGLKDHVDRAAIGRDGGHVLTINEQVAATWLLEASEHAQKCRLATAARTEQGKKLIRLDVERYSINRNHLAEFFCHIVDRDHWFRCSVHFTRSEPDPASGLCRRIAMMVMAMVIRIKTVEAAFTSGVAPKRTME